MITTRDTIETTISRSGHAACWCPPLDGIVQFGGWPPSALLESVITTEGFHCPLYFVDANDIVAFLEEKRCQEREEHANTTGYALLPPSATNPQETADNAKLRSLRAALHEVLDGCRESPAKNEEKDAGSEGVGANTNVSALLQNELSSLADASHSFADAVHIADKYGTESRPFRRHAAEYYASKLHNHLRDSEHPRHADPNRNLFGGLRDPLHPLHDVSADRRFPLDEEQSFLSSNSFTSSVSYQSGADARRMHSAARRATCETEITNGIRWRVLPCRSSPRSRHGHHLVYSGFRIFIIGGSYWALGNRMASSDMVYHIPSQTWEQVPSLLPPRFCAAVALSPLSGLLDEDDYGVESGEGKDGETTLHAANGGGPTLTDERQDVHHIANVSHQAPVVVYSFGGTDTNHTVTNTLSRVWLPSGQSEEDVPQYGSIPPPQFKGVLVCDISREITAKERQQGAFPVGKLFYCDGFREGRAVRPSLWIFDVHTCIWRRIGSAPDLVRAQVVVWRRRRSGLHNQPSTDDDKDDDHHQNHPHESTSVSPGAVERIDVFGGMPSKRGAQRRSAESHSLSCSSNKWDRVCTAVPRGLTAHCVVAPPEHHVLHDVYGVAAVCCGGNEDNPEDEGEQNGLGEPVSYLHLLSYRALTLHESCKYALSNFPVPQKSIVGEKDAVLDELF